MDLTLIAFVWLLLLALIVPVVVIWQGRWSPYARLRQRALAVAGEARHRSSSGASDDTNARRKLIQGKLKELESQRTRQNRAVLRALLQQSGLTLSLRGYILTSLGLGVLLWMVLLLKFSLLTSSIGAVGGGFALPRLVLRIIIAKRQAAFTENFAEALDVLVRGTRSGLPVGECLRIIGRELPDPVGYEFRMLVEAQRVGMTIDQALDRALERMPTTELKFFAIVLVIQQQTGGNLATTLDNLSTVLRARKRLHDKIQALSSEAKASASIIGSLPFLVGSILWLINPDYLGLLFTTNTGTYMLTGGGMWMGLGILVMRQMINFKI